MSIYAYHENAPSVVLLTGTETVPVTQSGVVKQVTTNNLQAITGPSKIGCLSGNLGTLSSLGTSAVATANATYVSSIFIPYPMLITTIGFLNGATAATDRLIYGLYAATGGAPLATTTLASNGTVAASANVFQEIALTATYQITQPGRYFIGWQANGTTTTRRSIAAATWVDVATLSVGTAGSAGVMASITAPTTFTADTGPIGYVI